MSPQSTADAILTLEDERKGDKMIVHCRGKLIAGVTDILTHHVKPLIPDNKHIILDLTDLTHMDSMGIGTVARLYVSAKTAGSKLELINLAPRIRQLLGITNLLSVLCEMCEQGISIRF
jgi:anti-anti-sigma factor